MKGLLNLGIKLARHTLRIQGRWLYEIGYTIFDPKTPFQYKIIIIFINIMTHFFYIWNKMSIFYKLRNPQHVRSAVVGKCQVKSFYMQDLVT